jgi:hypothetical protein
MKLAVWFMTRPWSHGERCCPYRQAAAFIMFWQFMLSWRNKTADTISSGASAPTRKKCNVYNMYVTTSKLKVSTTRGIGTAIKQLSTADDQVSWVWFASLRLTSKFQNYCLTTSLINSYSQQLMMLDKKRIAIQVKYIVFRADFLWISNLFFQDAMLWAHIYYHICIETYNVRRLYPKSLIPSGHLSPLTISANDVTRCPLAAEAKVRSQVIPRDLYSEKTGTGTGFYPVLRFSSASIISPMLHTHLHLHVDLTGRTKGRSLGTFQKSGKIG